IRTSAYVRGEMPRRSDAVWERSTTTSRVRPSDLPTVSVTGTAGASSRRATRSALASVVTGTPSTASRTSPGRTPAASAERPGMGVEDDPSLTVALQQDPDGAGAEEPVASGHAGGEQRREAQEGGVPRQPERRGRPGGPP